MILFEKEDIYRHDILNQLYVRNLFTKHKHIHYKINIHVCQSDTIWKYTKKQNTFKWHCNFTGDCTIMNAKCINQMFRTTQN